MSSTEARGLKTVERALTALEFVAQSPVAPTVREVARHLGHNVSSTYNIVNTLVGMGYLIKGPSGDLRVGSSVSALNAALERQDVYASLLRPFVDELRDATGETVYLSGLTDEGVVIQAVAEGRGSLRVSGLAIGYAGAEVRRASAKAIMAFLPDSSVKSILGRDAGSTGAASVDQRLELLAPSLATIRHQGFALDEEEFEAGICCIAAPVFDAAGVVRASVAVSAPATRLAALKGPVRQQVVATAEKMSSVLGAPSPSLAAQ